MTEIVKFPGKPSAPRRRGRPRGPARKLDARSVMDAVSQAEAALAGIGAIIASTKDNGGFGLDRIDHDGIAALQRVFRENIRFLKGECASILGAD